MFSRRFVPALASRWRSIVLSLATLFAADLTGQVARAQTLPEAGRVDGKVLDELEQPVRAAKVTFYDDARNMCGTTLTDGAGWFVSKALPLRCENILIAIEAKGFARHEQQAKLRWFDPELTVRARLRTADVVRGRVRQGDGAPIAGATVVVGDDRGWSLNPPANVIADADGNFTLRGVPIGAGVLLAYADGFEMQAMPIETPSAEPVVIEMAAGGGQPKTITVSGVNDEGASGLWLSPAIQTPHGWIAMGTRQLGSRTHRIGGIPTGWDLHFQITGRDPFGTDGIQLTGTATDSGFTASVPGPGELTGTVLDGDGKPVAGLALKARNSMLFSSLAVTDAQGRFTMRRPAAAGEELEVFTLSHGHVLRSTDRLAANDMQPTWGIVRVPSTGPLRLIADRAPLLRGKVVHADGSPASALATRLMTTIDSGRVWDSSTDGDGSFEFGRWAIAAQDVTVQVGDEPAAVMAGPFKLQEGEVKEIEVRMPAAHAYTFEVRDAANRPMRGARLALGQPHATTYFTNREGRCVVTCYAAPHACVVDHRGHTLGTSVTAHGRTWQLRLLPR